MLSRVAAVALVVGIAGCDGFVPPSRVLEEQRETPPAAEATLFDAAACGQITGRVRWSGPIPAPAPFVYGEAKGDGLFSIEEIANPEQPRIEPECLTVVGAVVFLRGIDPARSRPWDHPPVRIEMKDRSIWARQAEAAQIGFVRLGDEVEMVSAERHFQLLRGRGVEFFSYAFPEPGRPLRRRMNKKGHVELSSGPGFYWARAHLFVDDHPYYALSDAAGRFVLERVPPGQYEVVAWHPNWVPQRLERDPESGLVTRLAYGPPLMASESVTVERSGQHEVEIGLTNEENGADGD